MASTVFDDATGTPIVAAWLNDVNAGIYDVANATANTIARTIQDKMTEIISVKDFGALGDNAADDTAAIQAAVTWAQSIAGSERGVTIEFPAGIYRVSSPILVQESWIGFVGKGASHTILRTTSATNAAIIKVEAPAQAAVLEFFMRDMKLEASNTNVTGGRMLELTNVVGGWFDNLKIDNWYDGIYSLGCNRCFFSKTILSDNGRLAGQGRAAVFLTGSSTTGHSSDLHFSDIQILTNTGGPSINHNYAFLMRGIDGIYINNSHFIGGDYGIVINPTATSGEDYAVSLMVTNSYFDSTYLGAHVDFSGTAGTYHHFSFSNCFFRDSANDGVHFANLSSVPEFILFTGCTFKTNHGTGIKCDELVNCPNYVNICGGIFADNNRDGGATDGDILVRGTGWQIVGPSFQGGDPAGAAVDFRNESVNCRMACVDLRPSTAGLRMRNTGTGNKFAMCDGVTLKNGSSATITNPATTIPVTHGVGIPPVASDITLIPVNTDAAAADWWISNVTSTQFTINVAATPATAATWSWKVDVED